MWPPVLWNLLAFAVFGACLIWLRYRMELMRQQLDEEMTAPPLESAKVAR